MKKKKVIFDMLLNIVATSIPTFVLQLMILPSLSNYMDSDKYGLLVTILAALNVIPSTVGNVLNNIRLLYEEEYQKINIKGDFQLLLLISEFINVMMMIGLSIYYLGAGNFVESVLLVCVAALWLGREYHIVTFRLKLDYIAILMNNIWLVLGYFVGYIFYRIGSYWEIIYLFGFIFSYIHLSKKSTIMAEPLVRTQFFPQVTKDSIYLLMSNILARAINYADKILLYPLLGGSMVSIYYAATVFGKVVSLAITPINSVALSYLAKIEKKPDSLFKWTYMMGSIVCVLGYTAAIALSRPILEVIYPKFVDDAMHYIFVTTASIVVSVLTSMLTPFVLKYFDVKWQICINGITVGVYIFVSIILLHYWGLMGFCIGAFIANISKLLITTGIYIKVTGRESYL